MKNQNSIENIIADKKLTDNEHLRWRVKLKKLSSQSGIKSICVSKEELFIEYNPQKQTSESIYTELRTMGYPAKQLELVDINNQ